MASKVFPDTDVAEALAQIKRTLHNRGKENAVLLKVLATWIVHDMNNVNNAKTADTRKYYGNFIQAYWEYAKELAVIPEEYDNFVSTVTAKRLGM